MRPSHAAAAAVALLLLAGHSPAQPQTPQQTQQAPGLPGGAPEVQSTAPEVGAGRGAINGPPPPSSHPDTTTGGPRPAEPQSTAPRATPTPVTPTPAPAGFTARGGPDAAELELQRALHGGMIEGRVSIPNQSAGVLIQPEGRDWRRFRNQTLTWTGAVAVIGVLLVLAAYHLLKGPTTIEAGRSGRTIQRFGALERANHWMVATSFIVLGLSGLNNTFGAYLLRPLIGPEAFTTLTLWGQAAHQYLSFPFTLGLVVMLVVWLGRNLPTRVDVSWLRAGGPFAKGHPPSGKFNAGQKLLFWFVILAGAALAVSGYLLMFPFTLTDIAGQQSAHIVHGLLAMVMVAAILGHIYIGTIGMEGAFEAMGSGQVDVNWAREHHSLWAEEELAKERASATVPPSGARAAGAD